MRKPLIFLIFIFSAVLISGCVGSEGSKGNDHKSGDSNIAAAVDKPSKKTLSVMNCMEDQGLVVHYTGRGSFESDEQSLEQNEIWSEALDACNEELGINDDPTIEELKELYKLEVANHECLIENGFESHTPTSEQAFLDAWSQKLQPYDSLTAVFEVGIEVFNDAGDVCPSPRWYF